VHNFSKYTTNSLLKYVHTACVVVQILYMGVCMYAPSIALEAGKYIRYMYLHSCVNSFSERLMR